MNATEIILSAVMFVLFLGLWGAHNRLDDFGKWQRACLPNLQPRGKKSKEVDTLVAIINSRDTTISMLNAQIKGLNFENEKYISQIAAKDDYINELKSDLTKCKHDYACEVLGAKTETVKETLERWDGENDGVNYDNINKNPVNFPTQNVNNNKQ